MSRNELPKSLLRLLWRHLGSVDHVAVLVTARAVLGERADRRETERSDGDASPDTPHDDATATSNVTPGTRSVADGPDGAFIDGMHDGIDMKELVGRLEGTLGLTPHMLMGVLEDLVAADLLQRSGRTIRYAPDEELRATVDQLVEAYNTRPVTLVRAIYDRPDTAVRSFADAFRLRPPEEP